MDIQRGKDKTTQVPTTPEAYLDAVDMLRAQHREVEELFDALAKARHVTEKEKGVELLADKLLTHTNIEETIFYPAAREVDEKLVVQSFHEHDDIKAMIYDLIKSDVMGVGFADRVATLKEAVTRHVEEEEVALFPKCEDVFEDDALEELAVRMQAQMSGLDGAH